MVQKRLVKGLTERHNCQIRNDTIKRYHCRCLVINSSVLKSLRIKSNACMRQHTLSLFLSLPSHMSRCTGFFSIRWYHHSIGQSIKKHKNGSLCWRLLHIPSSAKKKDSFPHDGGKNVEEVVSFSYEEKPEIAVFIHVNALCYCVGYVGEYIFV